MFALFVLLHSTIVTFYCVSYGAMYTIRCKCINSHALFIETASPLTTKYQFLVAR